MLARHRGKILVASVTAALLVGAFVAVSANSETSQSPMSAAIPESTSASASQASMVPTASDPRGSARRSDPRRHVVQNVAPPRIPLILGIHH